jgi:hypothetical protein
MPAAPPPRGGTIFAKPRVEEESGEVAFSAIERLRSSLVRAERKAGDAAAAEEVPPAASAPTQAAGPAPGPELSPNMVPDGAASAPGPGAGEAAKKPPLDFLFRAKTREPQPEPFDAVWPKRGARRSEVPAEAGEAAKPAAAEALIDRPARTEAPPSGPDDVRPAAILKSGVVDGMAYTLYADGSIEAQLPQGTVRFGSIAELRAHIENNS